MFTNIPNQFEEKEWENECDPFQVAPGIYYVGTSYVGSYLIDTGEGLILLDQAFAESVYLQMESIRKLGYDPKDIKMLLVSHAHLDHCGGTRLFQEYTGAKVYMSREDNKMMKENPFWAHFGYVNWIDFDVDEFYDDNQPIKMGNIEIKTKLTPGHTPGTTSFFIDVKDKAGNVYHVGMHGGVGLNTMDKDFYEHIPEWDKGLLAEYIKGLEELMDYDIDIALPSHPNQIEILSKAGKYTEESNPFVDKSLWQWLISERKERAEKLYKEHKEAGIL